MNTAQRIVKNTGSLLVSNVIAQFLGFIAIMYLARVLGPGDFGKINFALAIVMYFTLIVDLGLPMLGTREVAREREKIKDYLSNILTLRLSLAVVGFCLLLLMTLFLDKPSDIKHLLILYGLGLIPSALFLDWAFQGVERMEYIGLGRILAGVTFLALVLWFIKNPEQLLLIPCFQVAGNLLSAGLLFLVFSRSFARPRFKFNLVSWKTLIKQAFPIGLTMLMGPIILYTDTVMLGFMRSNEDVGHYNAAFRIVLALVILGMLYQDAIYPVISNFYKTSLDSLKRVQSYSAKLVVTIALPLAVGGTILARPIMNSVFGTMYDDGIIALQILFWYFALECTCSVFSRGLLACNREKKRLTISVIMAITNVAINLILIPPLGLPAAAIAALLTSILGFFLLIKEFNKIVPIPIHNYLVRPFLACIGMGLFVYWGLVISHLHVSVLIGGGALIYGLFFYLMKGITREETKMIRLMIFNKQEQE